MYTFIRVVPSENLLIINVKPFVIKTVDLTAYVKLHLVLAKKAVIIMVRFLLQNVKSNYSSVFMIQDKTGPYVIYDFFSEHLIPLLVP